MCGGWGWWGGGLKGGLLLLRMRTSVLERGDRGQEAEVQNQVSDTQKRSKGAGFVYSLAQFWSWCLMGGFSVESAILLIIRISVDQRERD